MRTRDLIALGAVLVFVVEIVVGATAWRARAASSPAGAHVGTRETHVQVRVEDLAKPGGAVLELRPSGSRTARLPRQFVFESRGPRTAWKCAQVLYARAERAHDRGIWHFRLPSSCPNATAEAPYRVVNQLGGIALYRGATLLSFLAGSGAPTGGAAPAAVPPPATTPATPRHRRKTTTSEFWTRRAGRIVHVTQVEEEEEGP